MSSRLRGVMKAGDGFLRGLLLVIGPRAREGESPLETLERLAIHEALAETGYNQRDAAELLQVTPQVLGRRVYKYWPEGCTQTAKRRGTYRHGLRAVR